MFMASQLASVAKPVSPGDFAKLAAEVGLGLIDQGNQGSEVGRVGRQLVGDDDLVRRVHGDLAVVAGDEAVSRGLDAAVAVGEIALRLVGRRRGAVRSL